jgi:hypothetical protein
MQESTSQIPGPKALRLLAPAAAPCAAAPVPASYSTPQCAHTRLRPPRARRLRCAAAASRTAAATPRHARAAAGAGAGRRAGRLLPGLRSSGLQSARVACAVGRRRAPSPSQRRHLRTDSATSLDGTLRGRAEAGCAKTAPSARVHALGSHADRGGGNPEARGSAGRRGAQEMQSAASAAMARARCAPMSAPAKAVPRAGPPATPPIAIASRAPSCSAHRST